MKCFVPVKRVIDFNVKVQVKSDESGVETDHVKMSMNPFDEIALEEAVRLQERGLLTEVVAISVGNKSCQETLRTALAWGATRAILIENEEAIALEPLHIATILKTLVEQETPTLVLMGKQAIDDDCNQTGQMLAGLLGWPHGTYVSNLALKPERNQAEIIREVDGGLESLCLTLPAVITVDLRLNVPRYISLSNVMDAKSKSLTKIPLVSLGLSLEPHLQVVKVEAPVLARSLTLVKTVPELVDKLINEAKVIGQ